MREEPELLAQWAHGDAAAGKVLIERHYDAVARFFHNKSSAPEDLVQRTFLLFAEARTRYRGEASVRSFLLGIARNVLFDHFRELAKTRRIQPDFSVRSLVELSPGASTNLEKASEHAALVEALRHIPLDIQLTVELFYWENLTLAELSDTLGIPVGTVKSRLHRGRTLLREAIERLPAPVRSRESAAAMVEAWTDELRGAES